MTPSTSDLALLTSLLTLPVDDDHDFPSDGMISDSEEKAFSSMKAGLESGKWSRLTEKQRAWAKGVSRKSLRGAGILEPGLIGQALPREGSRNARGLEESAEVATKKEGRMIKLLNSSSGIGGRND